MAKPQVIPPDAYPQMVSRKAAAKLSRALRSAEAADRGTQVIQNAAQGLCEGVRDYVRELEEAIGDHQITSDMAHEIRGFAETAGLRATGRIADGLCRYFEAMDKFNAEPDTAVIALHISAIVRAAYAEDEAGRMSDVVAQELAALVSYKLAETKAQQADCQGN
jgi:hypothetical protein